MMMNDDHQLNKLLEFDHQQINIPYIPQRHHVTLGYPSVRYILDHQSVVLKVTARRQELTHVTRQAKTLPCQTSLRPWESLEKRIK